MIAGITLDESIKLFNSKGGTRTKQIVKVLRQLGFNCKDELQKFGSRFVLPTKGIYLFKLTYNDKKGSHWVIWNGKEHCWYDPGRPHKLHKDFHWRHKETMYPTSYLKINDQRNTD